ncbi:carboxypeptidase-like regulatory domain-containing protein [Hymenobacter sp. J193]|uniref:carboxypeptidase-like regulatory domain-containing protein n=1 Tax=Hymenobacter sp. J193 TaxID=2898429 RepID=UPI002150C833|nr:carboxypeptidase-like regulatory domain-containing protein [Hymenobacter sp. J193]MCR5888002.1 carboxypeptidase-like regulatory domain-containing protein [Hymenobacter sp. J193]
MPTINVPKPCGESWSDMTPATQGSHCAACNKVVVDFTRMTDAELLAFLHRQPATGCGRFTSQQLNRPLVVPAASTPWRQWLAAAALTLGLGEAVAGSAQAQASVSQLGQQLKPTQALPISYTTASETRQVSISDTSVLIRGRVLDEKMGLPGVTVQLQGTQLDTSTDSDGYFQLLLEKEAAASGTNLVFSFVGFETQQVAVPRNGEIQVVLVENVTGNWESIPFPMRWWQRIGNLFRR